MPRVEIPLIGPSYTNRERPLSAQVARNLWPEINQEARNQVCLHNTAGIRIFSKLEGIDRGMTDFNNLMYCVNGSTLYSIDDTGQSQALGTIDGTNRCVFANDSSQLIITTGGTPYRYTYANGLEAITDPDLTNPTSVAYLNQQFILDNNNGTWGEFVTSSIDADFAVDALDFANAESHPDDIVRIMAFRQLVYFFGSKSIEPWQNTGVGNPPFARVNSGVQNIGLAGTHAIVATSDYMYFLDNKRIPRRSNGLNFVPIGNPALGVEFAKYSKIDDCICFEFVQDNQQFIAYTFPTADKTWCFHEPSGSWFELSYIKTGAMNDQPASTLASDSYSVSISLSSGGTCNFTYPDTTCSATGVYGITATGFTPDTYSWEVLSGNATISGSATSSTVSVVTSTTATSETFTLKVIASDSATGATAASISSFTQTSTEADYDPGMMTFSTGHYSKTSVTRSGNKVTVMFRFNRASFTGGGVETPFIIYDNSSNVLLATFLFASDYATTDQRNKLQVVVKNSALTNICKLFTTSDMTDGADHLVFFSFDGDAGTAMFYADGVDEDDTGHASRVAPTTGSLYAGASSSVYVGAANGSQYLSGQLGYVGYRDAYLTNPTDFYNTTYGILEPDTSTWTEWGAQPAAFAIEGKLDTANLGSLGSFTKTGTITGPA